MNFHLDKHISNTQMEDNILESLILKHSYLKAEVKSIIKMDHIIKVNGIKDNFMGKGLINGWMAHIMKAAIKMEKNMVMENICIKLIIFMKENGLKDVNMELVH